MQNRTALGSELLAGEMTRPSALMLRATGIPATCTPPWSHGCSFLSTLRLVGGRDPWASETSATNSRVTVVCWSRFNDRKDCSTVTVPTYWANSRGQSEQNRGEG